MLICQRAFFLVQDSTNPLNRTDSKASEYTSVSNSPSYRLSSNYVNSPHSVSHRSFTTLVPHVGTASYPPTSHWRADPSKVVLSVTRLGKNLRDDLRDFCGFLRTFIVGQESPRVRAIYAFLMSD